MIDNRERVRQYNAETRAFCREHGICQVCRKEPVEPGKHSCSACLQRNQEYKAAKLAKETAEERETRLKYMHNYHQNRYYQRKSQGICVRCGRPVHDGKTTCTECRLIDRRQKAIRRGSRITDYDGMCSRRHKKPRLEGKRVCEDCYPVLVDIIRKNRQVGIESGAYRKPTDDTWKIIRAERHHG